MENQEEVIKGCDLAKYIEREEHYVPSENNAAYIKQIEGRWIVLTVSPTVFINNEKALRDASLNGSLFLNVIGGEEHLILDKVVEVLNDSSNDINSVPEAVKYVFQEIRKHVQGHTENVISYKKRKR